MKLDDVKVKYHRPEITALADVVEAVKTSLSKVLDVDPDECEVDGPFSGESREMRPDYHGNIFEDDLSSNEDIFFISVTHNISVVYESFEFDIELREPSKKALDRNEISMKFVATGSKAKPHLHFMREYFGPDEMDRSADLDTFLDHFFAKCWKRCVSKLIDKMDVASRDIETTSKHLKSTL